MILGILQGKILYSCKLGSVQFIPRTWDHSSFGKKVDSIAFYFLKTCIISCA